MNAPMTANDVALNLAKLARELEASTDALDVADRAAVVGREDFTLAYARAFLSAEGAMDIRRYVATEQTHSERLTSEAADQVVRGMRARRDTLKVRIDVGRSVGTALRAELTALGGTS